MKKIIYLMLGVFLLFSIENINAFIEIGEKPEPIELPEPIPCINCIPDKPIPVPVLLSNIAEIKSSSTQRHVINCNIHLFIGPKYVTLFNIGSETCYDFILWEMEQYQQSYKFYIDGLKGLESTRIYTDTLNKKYDVNFWSD